MFALAVFVFGEPLSIHQLIAFVFIWAALAVYTMDSIKG
jgi:chloramphenicol-sensitive protein RarD